ncbi:hypothetical protein R5R35_014027 [Gryllus longicercus]|uniref:alpha-glucosidase n=1 Tax=Gryllus longicercus TaxID=2509291 RepID=A0AAN9W0P0_9ORTH
MQPPRAPRPLWLWLWLALGLGLAPPPAALARTSWWHTAVIYHVYPLSFLDSNGDGVGDLNGVIQKLPYVADLGVDALRLAPVFRRGMHGCPEAGVVDFRAVAPVLGTADDMERLLRRAREFGLRVILDIEPNHSSRDHEWFQKSVKRVAPFTDLYVWRNGKANSSNNNGIPDPPNNWLSVHGGSAWEWNSERQQFYLHQFGVDHPDFNYRHYKVIEEMKDILTFWLEKGVAGFAMKDVSFLLEDNQFHDERELYDRNNSSTDYSSLTHVYTHDVNDTYSLVETWKQLLETFAHKTDRVSRLLMIEADPDHIMNYYGPSISQTGGANFPINSFFVAQLTNESNAMDYSEAVHHWHVYMHDGRWPNWMLGSPDISRVASRISPYLVDGLNMLLMLLPGTALSYSGEEIGMTDTEMLNFNKSRCFKHCHLQPHNWHQIISKYSSRTPFQWDSSTSAGFSTNMSTWLPVNRNYRSVNLHLQRAASNSHYRVFRRLVAMRQEATIRKGQLAMHALSDFVLSFSRSLQDKDTFVTIINFGANTVEVNLKPYNLPKIVLVHTASVNSRYRMSDRVHSKKIELQPYSSVVVTTGKAYEYQYPNGVSSVHFEFTIHLLNSLFTLSLLVIFF